MKDVNKQAIKDLIRSFHDDGADDIAFREAVRWRMAEEVATLLDFGVDVDSRDTNGRTPIMLATDPAIARLLVERGADVNARDHEGRTPLHWFLMGLAKEHEAESYVRTLLKLGADRQARMNDGTTPLMLAKNKYGPRVSELLVANKSK